MQPQPLLLLSLLFLAISSPLLWLLRPHRFRHVGWVAAIPPALVTAMLLTQLQPVSQGIFLHERYPWSAALGLEIILRLDGLALFFGLIIAGIGAAVALYTGYYLEDHPRQGYFYSLLFLFMVSMLGIVWSDNLLTLFVFWEGTSITSYLLIAFEHEKKEARDGGRRALIVTGFGGLAMLAGMVLLGQSVGTYTISDILFTPNLDASPYYGVALLLILLGTFTKSAQFPFHFWLPGAMAAPTPASAYLHSATMVKAGIFLLARLHPALGGTPLWFWSLLTVGAATMLLGAVSAFRYYDLKAVLANATVSQLGFLVMLLAFHSEMAYVAAVVGILAHALYKGPLFLVAGIVDHATGTRDLRRFARLGRELPWVAATAVLAGLSMAGFPPFFGFLAKETLLETFFHHAEHDVPWVGWLGLGVAALGGALFVGYSLTLLWEAFFRREAPEDAAHVHHGPGFGFVFAPLALTLVGTAIPFALAAVEKPLLTPTASAIAGHPVEVHLALWHGITPTLLVSLAAIAVGVGFFTIRSTLRRLLTTTPPWLNGAYLFDRLVYALYDLATWSTRTVQGGTLASQASVVLLAAVVALAWSLTQVRWPEDLPIDWNAGVYFEEVVLVVLAIVAAITTVRAQTRLNAIVSIGVVGITVTLFFVIFDAPDLALTQLLVDILTVVLLVLVFYKIPPQSLPPLSRVVRIRNLVVSVLVGLLGFGLTLFSVGPRFLPTISDYFSLNAVPGGHGANVVNVILVDFRGFDTMGEITVLAIAAVGGYALLRSARLRPRPGDRIALDHNSEEG